MGPEGNILENSSISTFQQGLTHSALTFKSILDEISHLSITVTAWSILDSNDGAKKEEDDCQVSKSLVWETAQGRDDDPDVCTCRQNETWRRKRKHWIIFFISSKTYQGRQEECHSDQQNAKLPLSPKNYDFGFYWVRILKGNLNLKKTVSNLFSFSLLELC